MAKITEGKREIELPLLIFIVDTLRCNVMIITKSKVVRFDGRLIS